MRSATSPTLPLGLILGTLAAVAGAVLIGTVAHAQTAPLAVNATVAAACTVSAPNPLNFGTYVQGQSNNKDATVDITFTCGNGLAVRIDMDGGIHGSVAQRAMNGAGTPLLYQIYKDSARGDPWGTGSAGKSEIGSGSAKNVTVYGRIPSNQSVPAASYSDTVTVSLVIP